MKQIYQMTKEELFKAIGSGNGLKEEEALRLLKEHGANVLEEKEKKSVIRIFLEQFADTLVLILIAAAGVSMISGNVESTLVIFAVLILNAVLGTVQYVKAEKSLDSLKELSTPKAKVLRDGVKKEIDSRQIVPGDVLLLEAGDVIPADGRIIVNHSLQVNESALTGESANVDKKDMEIETETALGDRYNMVYSGSLVTYGRADVLVTATGSAICPELETEAWIQAWYPGSEGGTALANLLFGKCSPSGKLPVTFYADAGKLPAFTD